MIEEIFEKLLWQSRLMIILPVVTSLVSAFIMVILGTYDVVNSVIELPNLFIKAKHEDSAMIITHVVSSVDAYLIATVLLVFSVGLYELFISKINSVETRDSSKVLIVRDLDQLKEKIAKLVIMVLIVTFFQETMNFEYRDVLDLLYLASGIFLISLAVYFTHKSVSHKGHKKERDHHSLP